MKYFFNIANLLTLGNLICGILAIIYGFQGATETVMILFLCCLLFDFLDGFVARMFNIQSDVGADLDSLADIVSFGVLPGLLVWIHVQGNLPSMGWVSYIALIYPICAAIRLAIFNVEHQGSTDFIGLNTPAASIGIVGVILYHYVDPLETSSQNLTYALLGWLILLSMLTLSSLSMLSLKPKFDERLRTRWQIVFIVVSILLVLVKPGLSAVSIILWYIVLSVLKSMWNKTSS